MLTDHVKIIQNLLIVFHDLSNKAIVSLLKATDEFIFKAMKDYEVAVKADEGALDSTKLKMMTFQKN